MKERRCYEKIEQSYFIERDDGLCSFLRSSGFGCIAAGAKMAIQAACGELRRRQVLPDTDEDTSQSLTPGLSGPDMVRIAGRKERDMVARTYPGRMCEQITGNRPDVVLTSTTETIADGARRTVFSDRITMSKEEFCSGGYDRYLMEERPAKVQ